MEQRRAEVDGNVTPIVTAPEPVVADTPEAHPELIADLSAVAHNDNIDRKRASLGVRVTELERRLDAVVAAQVANTPLFRAALERILKMRNALHDHGNSLMRLEALARNAVSSQEATAAGINEMLSIMTTAKSWGGRLKKYWPRIATFALGVAVARGWISGENGKNLLHLFGL